VRSCFKHGININKFIDKYGKIRASINSEKSFEYESEKHSSTTPFMSLAAPSTGDSEFGSAINQSKTKQPV
jgi:hypothetical protein